MNGAKVTGLGPFCMYDEEGNVIMEGQMKELVFETGYGRRTIIKATEPKRCPQCGAELK